MGFLKGWFGEKKAAFKIWLFLDKEGYKRFHNVIIPAANGTTQIDHILVSQYGIFIIETKNKGGWIFGSEDQAKWTQSFYGKKYPFQNPLRQTYRQKKVLADFLSIAETHIHTVIYFVGDCKFKTKMPSNVIKSGLGKYVKSFREQLMSENDVNQVVKRIERHISESNISTSDHVRSLQNRRKSKTICPNCGASLKLKSAKKGSSAGSKFLGCESYPKCRFTRSA